MILLVKENRIIRRVFFSKSRCT